MFLFRFWGFFCAENEKLKMAENLSFSFGDFVELEIDRAAEDFEAEPDLLDSNLDENLENFDINIDSQTVRISLTAIVFIYGFS